jgi:four helix bundle protein
MSYKVTRGQNARRAGQAELQEDSDRAQKFQTFEDLEVYKAVRAFRKAMYAVARGLPDFEKYDLGGQIRRAAVSLTNNIAEGHGRFHYPDRIRFFLHSRGSFEELVDDLNVCLDENYLPSEEVAELKEQARGVLILINGYLRHLRSRCSTVREGDEAESESMEALDDLLSL